ncbi:uncharacterized protein LOC127745511 [Arachis duranensis]|uniref:Uncharacterized protein LOC127745511 n=1 Tax=Arachis duranensis TaxID=130453 RepID=A0A9C6THL1_ARADU|nr:uncharacterized protein LOC127745511 [Arachis duranensis]
MCQNIVIPDDILVKDWDDPIEAICKVTYPELFDGTIINEKLKDRAILAPTLQLVDEINQFMMSLNSAEAQTYYSSDKACPTESYNDLLASIHTPEFLNTIRCSGVPNHELTLKVGTPIMLLRNIDHATGMCNGTRLVVTKLRKHIIEAHSRLEGFYSHDDFKPIRSSNTIQIPTNTISYNGIICDDYQQKSRSITIKGWFNT